MIFSLEALRAKHGDCLLLHYGPADAPELALIDGGPGGVYRRTLEPRLDGLRADRELADDEPLEIALVMVSHIDDDHINGVLDLTAEMVEAREDGRPLPFRIEALWHNSFDDVVGTASEEMFRAATASMDAVTTAGGGVGAPGFGAAGAAGAGARLRHPGAAILASVPQGRDLRNDARRLGLPVNPPFGDLVSAPDPEDGAGERSVDLEHGLTLRVLGPGRKRIEELQEEWDRELEDRGLAAASAEAAAYVDRSVANLASIVVLAQMQDKRMLLTGDARGDDILTGLADAELLDDGTFHVDLLKLPHHGSDRNVETDFFRAVTADHYVVSGDGSHGNPEVATFEMILAARGDEAFTLHLTYPPDQMEDDYPRDELRRVLVDAESEGARFEMRAAPEEGRGLVTDLLEPLEEGPA